MKSIQSRLLIMLLIFIVLPYFLSVFFIYTYTKNSVEQHELENSREQLKKNAEELEQYFDGMIDFPYILYRDPDLFRIFNNGFEDSIYFSPKTMEKSLETFYLMRNEIRQIRFYIDKNKESFTLYNAMISTRRHQPDFLDQSPIKGLYASDSNYLIEPPRPLINYNNAAIVPKSDKTMVMTFHHKISDVLSKKFLGIITIDIDLGGYARICNNLVQDDASSVLLIDSHDRVLYANQRSLIGKPLPEGEKQRLDGNRSRQDDDILLSKELSGSLNGWKLIKITSSQSLYEDVRKTAYTNILVGIGVGLLGLLMIGIISNRITRPIARLSSKVRSIEGGNMNVPFDDARDDEIGHLESHMKDMMNRINSHIDREYKLEIENRKNQFRALKSQINPHFLFNALQSIGAVALRSNVPKVYQLLTFLSKMMRYSLQADQWVRVRDETDYTKAYLSLQTERFGKNVSYSVEMDESILDITIPSMILQPLAENFFKHTYEEGYSSAHLSIYGEKHGEYLHFLVENNGPGLTAEELHTLRNNIYTPPYEGIYSHEHIGLKNIRDRLLLRYGPSAEMIVDSNNGKGFFRQHENSDRDLPKIEDYDKELNTVKALIIDDEFNVRDVIRHLGQWEQYGITKLLEASNGKEAKKWIEKEQPELIFTDIKMPRMTGMELIEWLDSISYPGKVIFITGYNDYSYMRKAIQHSSFDYLLKPIESEAFNHTLEKSVQAWKDDFQHAEVLEDAKKLRRNQLATAICLGDHSDSDSLAEFLPESEGYELTLLSFYQMHNPDSYIENLAVELTERKLGNAFSLQTDLNLCLVITIRNQWLSVEEWISQEFDIPVRLVTGDPIESISEIRTSFHALEKKLEEQDFRSIHRLDEIDAARRMEDIVSYVETYYMEDLSLEKLSNVFFLSREHISRKFKQETGMTLSKYITELRISQAKSWLHETDKSIYSISTMLGYQDEIYFSKLFKKVVGMTPFEFRRETT